MLDKLTIGGPTWCGIPSSAKMDDFIRSLSNLGYNESNTSLCADLPPQQERDSCKLHNEEEVRQLLLYIVVV